MMKKIIFLTMAGVLLTSCFPNNNEKGKEDKFVVVSDAKCLVAVVRGYGKRSTILNMNVFQKPLPCKEAFERAEYLQEVSKKMFFDRDAFNSYRRYYYPYLVSVGEEK